MSQRSERLAASIHRSAARILQEEFSGEYVTVADVDATPGGDGVTIWLSIFNDSRREELFAHAQSITGKIRKRLGRDIQMRHVPEVTLKLDERGQNVQAIENTLREL